MKSWLLFYVWWEPFKSLWIRSAPRRSVWKGVGAKAGWEVILDTTAVCEGQDGGCDRASLRTAHCSASPLLSPVSLSPPHSEAAWTAPSQVWAQIRRACPWPSAVVRSWAIDLNLSSPPYFLVSLRVDSVCFVRNNLIIFPAAPVGVQRRGFSFTLGDIHLAPKVLPANMQEKTNSHGGHFRLDDRLE